MAILKILTKHNTITVEETINFTPIEMPYGARGFGFNGSSTASAEDLDKYWKLVREILEYSNIATEDYITLLSIEK